MNTKEFKGKFITTEKKDVKIHTYISPEETFHVTSHVIETKTKLVIIDGQFMLDYANELACFISELSKPVECIIITHSHPDHFLGLESLEKYPIASTKDIIEEIEQQGDSLIEACRQFYGNRIANHKVVPTIVLSNGLNSIAGIQFDIEQVEDAEAGKQLLIKLPEYGILISQDLVFNNVHLFFAEQKIENWLKIINILQKQKEYNIILPGHGEPSGREVYDSLVEYLQYVKDILPLASSKDEIKTKLIKRFPKYRAAHLIDISGDYVFHGEHVNKD